MAQDIPKYFLLRSGSHYIVASGLVAVKQDALPPSVEHAIYEAFSASDARIEAIEIPGPGDPCDDDGDGAVVMLARMAGMHGMDPTRS